MNAPNKKQKSQNIRKEIYSRSLFLYYVFTILAIMIVGNILYIQYGPEGSELRAEAKNSKNFAFKTTYAKRGDILSYDNRILSTSIPTYHIYMDFMAEGLADSVFKANVGPLAGSLANFFKDKPAKVYLDSMNKWHREKRRYRRISPRRIDYIELKEVLKFPLYSLGRNRGGFMLDTLNKRFFPNETLARRTIGRINETGTNYGIEGFFNKELKGTDGVTATQKISGNFWMPLKHETNVSPIDGYDVVSTIDIEVQRVAEDALRKQLSENEALWGTAILMEVETGEIRAIANLSQQKDRPTEYVEDYNHAIGKTMEPGSTFKLVTLMALLDDAKASINESVNTEGGRVNIGRAIVVDTKSGGYGTISLKRCFEVSSNIGFAKEINKYYASSPLKFINYLNKIKLGELYDLKIAGEQKPVIRKPGDKYWDGTTLTMMAYGYAIMITPLRTLAIYNAIANNGEYVKPRIVTEIRNKGEVVKEFPKEVIVDKICTDATIAHIKNSLEGVVNEGTARNILLNNNYRVAGKTGTAQVAKGKFGYSVNGGKYYLATIVGYFPADKPKYSCIVAIETFRPDGSAKKYYGGSLSGPVFRAIADKVYSQSPEWANSINKPLIQKASGDKPTTPIYTTPQVKQGLEKFVTAAATTLKAPVIKTINNDTIKGVPNVVGMAVRDAIIILEQKNLYVKFSGKGSIKTQSIAPGTPYNPGDTVLVYCDNYQHP